MRSGFYLLMHCWLMNIHMQICSCTFVVGVHVRMSMVVCMHTCVCIDFS